MLTESLIFLQLNFHQNKKGHSAATAKIWRVYLETGENREILFSRTCLKRPLTNRLNKDLNDIW